LGERLKIVMKAHNKRKEKVKGTSSQERGPFTKPLTKGNN